MQAFDRFLLVVLLPLVADSEEPVYKQDVRIGAEKQLNSPISDLLWLGEDRNVVLLRTGFDHLHRSADGGETWADLHTHFNRSAATPPNTSPHVPIRRLVRSTADPKTVFAQGPEEDHFVSVDAGETWDRVRHTGMLQGFLFHSNRKNWALMSSWTEACRSGRRDGAICSHNLYFTKDLGKTFSLVQTHVVQFSWGRHEFSQDDRVYFTHFRNKTTSQKRLTRWMEGVDFAFTEDLDLVQPEATELVPGGNKFQISYEYILVVKVRDPVKQNVSLMISSDGAKTFGPALLPHRLWQHSFALLDASEGALVLHVNQGRDVGDVYISDRSGRNFTTSLERNVRVNGLCAFEKVMNLNGIFIANVFAGSDDNRTTAQDLGREGGPMEDLDDIENASTGSQVDLLISIRSRRLKKASPGRRLEAAAPDVAACPGGETEGLEGCPPEAQSEHIQRVRRARASRPGRASGYRRLTPQGPTESRIHTVISFDAGGEWTHLQAPETDSEGKPTKCDSKSRCFLHLHDFTDLPSFAPVYSYRNAVGILMATGNVGPYLSFRREETNTYMSRDGGLTWMEVHKGTYIYEFGNHGGLLVMADMVHETKMALFSWDEGRKWHKFKIADEFMKVDNIIIEPNAISSVFLIYGTRHGAGISRFLDLSKVHSRSCRDPDKAGQKKSDYMTWKTPCILGEQGVYTRRKRASKCFNVLQDRYSSKGACKCKQIDYECEVGFERKVGSKNCHVTSESALRRGVMWGCIPGKQVAVPKYRKVPGDKCENGWHPPPHFVNCTNSFAPSTAAPDGAMRPSLTSLLLAFTLATLMGTLVCGVLLIRFPKLRKWVYKAAPRVQPPAEGTRIGREMEGLANGMDQQQGYLRYE